MGILGFFKTNKNKIKDSFKKVKDDFSKVELKLNALIYEKNYLKSVYSSLNQRFNLLFNHYSDSINKYNSLHKHHSSEINDVFSELNDIKNILRILTKKMIDITENERRLKEEIEHIKHFQENIYPTLDSMITKRLSTLNKLNKPKSIKNNEILLSVTEQQILTFLAQLSNEYGNSIPVSALLDELYNGNRKKASTLSNYLNMLERKGLIKRYRQGRQSYVLVSKSF